MEEYDLVEIMRAAVAQGASDVHLCANNPPMVRVHGELLPLAEQPLDAEGCRQLILSGLNEHQRAQLEDTWELDFLIEIRDIGRFRGNVHFCRGSLQAAFRLISNVIPELAELGHRPSILDLCKCEQGLILVTGSTGSGKSTTLASMVQAISRQRTGVIVTIEDPIEYLFTDALCLIKQREVGTDTKSFAAALKHSLRQDPDVIVISEMRDLETIQAALTAAETGHLVIASLHTIDAPKSIDRMVDVFPSNQQNQILTQLANSLKAIVAQRLLPRKDRAGRVLACETMISNAGVSACIRDRRVQQIIGLIEIGKREGMNTIDDSLLELYENGLISYEEACLNARSPDQIPVPVVKKKGFFG